MLATKEDITDYIPHRRPMVMVDKLVEASDQHAVSGLVVEEDNVLVDAGHLTEAGLVENMAQTAALQLGFRSRSQQRRIPMGYLAAVSDLRIDRLPLVNDSLRTTIRITNHIGDIVIAYAQVEVGRETYCSGEMKVFVKQE